MFKSRRIRFALFASALFFLMACETASLIQNLTTQPTPPPQVKLEATTKPTRAPDAPFDYGVLGTPRCTAGDDSASIVRGSVTDNGAPVPALQVQASSGPGAEPISEQPAETNADGNFEVTFICDGAACSGAFWVWLINADGEQISPFVQFNLDQNCRNGSVNFSRE